MFQLKHISLTQFKNYNNYSIDCNASVIGICGPNGIGKTNLLDAIYYLCFARSYFNKTDNWNVQQGSVGFRIEGHFEQKDHIYTTTCILRENSKKEIEVDGEVYIKLSTHIGRFPCIMVVPDDIALINDGGEERRKFIDTLFAQLDVEYLQQLITYNKYLQQRNSLLKTMAEQKQTDRTLLDIYNTQLAIAGQILYEKRAQFLATFIPQVLKTYNSITGFDEQLELQYESDLRTCTMAKLLEKQLPKDLLLQRTTAGIHKDDILMLLNNQPFKNVASQGQKKTALFALKLAAFDMLKVTKGFSPLLLLDDVFEKLDEQRLEHLLQWVTTHDVQIFITDTHVDRLQKISTILHKSMQMIMLS